MSSINAYLHLSKHNQSLYRIKKSDLMLVQHFENSCKRSRTEVGLPYGDTSSAMLTVTVRDVNYINELYKRLKTQETFDYRIFTNATFSNGELNLDKCNILTVTGYIVDIAENLVYSSSKANMQEPKTVTIQILISVMAYKQNGHERGMVITK